MESQKDVILSNAMLLQNVDTEKFFRKCREYAREFSLELYKGVNSKEKFLKRVNYYFDYIKNLNNDGNLQDNSYNSRFNKRKVFSYRETLRRVIIRSFYLFHSIKHSKEDENLSKVGEDSFEKLKADRFSLEMSDHIAILEIICLKAHNDKSNLIRLHVKNFELLQSRELLCKEIYNLIDSGRWYFPIVNFMLTDKRNFPFVNSPLLFEKLAFFGPIHAKSLEEIVELKDGKFFDDTIKVLRQLRSYMENVDLFKKFYKKNISRDFKRGNFNVFKHNVRNLFTKLKRTNDVKEPLPRDTAIIQLGRHVKMCYRKKMIDNYYLNDVAYIIICQHPSLKRTFENLLLKEKDFKELERWKSIHIDNDPFPRYFPLEDKINDDLYAENSNYLSLPSNITVKICLSNDEITEAITAINEANEKGFTIVGFDCEWSPFCVNQNVSLIQVSLNNTCFIIDASYGDHELVVKLGLQPKGDIVELLKTFYNVDALCCPTHTCCLTEVIKRFNIANSNIFNNDSNVEQVGNIEFIIPHWKDFFNQFNSNENSKKNKDNDNENIHQNNEDISLDNDKIQDDNILDIENVSQDKKSIKEKETKKENEKEKLTDAKKFDMAISCTGLSKLCKLILGKELEKTEQCSVWDRRPLRISQIRYAALDAEASRMIFLKLEEWGKELNIDVEKIVLDCPKFTLRRSKFFSVDF
uniref:3'-5' exonuclease domain-containing protein n=1 Tax=Strongyloides stercoralis TaxID=6248 RepID=A0A0K0EFK4_STRER